MPRGSLTRPSNPSTKRSRSNPASPRAYGNLGLAMHNLKKFDEAIAAYRRAISINPNLAGIHCNLGHALTDTGRFREALESLEKGHELGSRQPGWRLPSEVWVREARRMAELEERLPTNLKGEANPEDAEESLALADLCYQKGLQAASARFWERAFAGRPALLDDLSKAHRYNAACAATLAGSGSGKDEPPPTEADRAEFRKKALGWLRADLAAWAKVLEGGNEPARKQFVSRQLAHWKEDADLAGIRDEGALAKLPEGEREGFRAALGGCGSAPGEGPRGGSLNVLADRGDLQRLGLNVVPPSRGFS